MTIIPLTTPAPNPSLIFMPQTPRTNGDSGSSSSSGSGPLPSSVPSPASTSARDGGAAMTKDEAGFVQPKLRLEVRDLAHPGARKFLSNVNAGEVLDAAVRDVLRLLYVTPAEPHTHAPPTRSVTVVLRDMDGVAYTTGSDLDNDHKEIHFSLRYINGISPATRLTSEITGVLTHELVHCFQWDARGSCPGGLVEGVADWVRLNCSLSPPHWKREPDGAWDSGYQRTAYFLEYLEGRFGTGTVRRLNEKLRLHTYEALPFWTELLGRPVEQLWDDYVKSIKGDQALVKGSK